MSPIRSSRNSSRQIPYGRFTQYPTASPASTQTFIPPIALTELLDYFDVANDQLYDLLDSDTELHRIVHTIELFHLSNQSLEEIRARQEQYILDQFELALRNGLHGRLSPMVVQQRQPTRLSIPLAHTMDGSDTRDNRPLQSIEVGDHGDDTCPRSLLERMTLPDDDAVPITPAPSGSLPRFACTICSLTRARVDHNTPDCRHYICFACGRTQPGHWPEDCPGRTPDRYYDASD